MLIVENRRPKPNKGSGDNILDDSGGHKKIEGDLKRPITSDQAVVGGKHKHAAVVDIRRGKKRV